MLDGKTFGIMHRINNLAMFKHFVMNDKLKVRPEKLETQLIWYLHDIFNSS